MENLSPIVLFVYNRIAHVTKTVDALKQNDFSDKSDLIIISDGAKSDKEEDQVQEVREFIKTIDGFKSTTIIEREKNYGLANNVISGVTEAFENYSKVIVLEDDVVCSKTFLYYINNLLLYYANNDQVFSVSGYTFPIKIPEDYKYDVYFSQRASSWGWGTWKDRWARATWNMNDLQKLSKDKESLSSFLEGGSDLQRMIKDQLSGKINSWAIRWTLSHFVNNAYCVYPTRSRVKNIGMGRSATHTRTTKKYDVEIFEDDGEMKLLEQIKFDKRITDNFKKFFSQNKLKKIMDYILATVTS